LVYQIAETFDEPRRLTQAVLQIVDMLGLYQAELARILLLKCGDIGRLAAARQSLEPATPAWKQALLLVRCYRALYVIKDGDGVAMRGVPHLLIVDDGRLADVVTFLEARQRGPDAARPVPGKQG
jgi:hypothetical protein